MFRNALTLLAVEEAIASNHGDLILACRTLALSPIDLNQWAASDPEVSQRIRNAQLLGWASLESEAIRRATGYKKEVWYQGVMVGEETVYSDGLLSQLLKARVPAHAPEQSHTALQVNVNVMPRAESYEEWQQQRLVQLNGPDTMLKPVEEVEYEEVTSGLPDWL